MEILKSETKARRLASRKETAAYLNVAYITIRRKEQNDPDWPKPIRESSQLVRYDLDDVDQWLERKKQA